jgi:O-antigen/teichoic acid export membrane protein
VWHPDGSRRMTLGVNALRLGGNEASGQPVATASTGSVTARRLASSSATAFAIHFAGAGLSYCSQMVLARVAGAASFGIYSYVLAWVTILAYFSALGSDVSLLRLASIYRAREAWSLLRGVICYAEWSAVLGGMAVVLGGGILVLSFQNSHFGEQAGSFLIGFLLVPVWALLWIRSSIVRAFGGVASALAPDRMVRDGVLLVLVTLASQVCGWAIDAPRAMALTLISSATGLLLVSIAANRKTGTVLRGRLADYSESAAWRRAALPLVLLAVGEVASNRTGVVLLGWAGETTNAGIFALVFNIATVVALPRIAVNALFAPTVADLYARNDHVALRQVIARTSCWTLLGALAIALPLAATAEHLLGWFGEVFVTGAPALRIVLFAQVVAGACGSQLYLMTMTGHERAAASLLVVSMVIGVVGSFVLIALMALDGAAIATAMALVLWNALMAWFVWRRLRLLPGVFTLLGPKPAGPEPISLV